MFRATASSSSTPMVPISGWRRQIYHAHALRRRTMSTMPEESKQIKQGDAARKYSGVSSSTRWMTDTREARRKVTIQRLQQMKESGTPIATLTAYDYPTGRACEEYGVDITLVGDSLAQVCLGYDSTTRLTLPEMLHHTRAVARGSKNPLLVVDMPFGSYHSGADDAVRNAARVIQEGGAEAVKLEGGEEILESVYRLTRIGIPVFGHVGLLPQRHVASSGYRVQGRNASSARSIFRASKALEEAGAFAIVLEAIPSRLGEYITKKLRIPTIGIGAGHSTDGQVLVWDDMMGTWNGHQAKFVRRFGDAKREHKRGVLDYVDAVRRRSFPGEDESYDMDEVQWRLFLDAEGQ